MNAADDEIFFPLPELVEQYKCFPDFRGSFKVLNRTAVPTEDEPGSWSGWNFQTNVSVSKPGVLRGMHWQKNFPQAKLVRVLYGRVLDVVVDLRAKSPNFKRVFSFVLSERGEQLFVPRGFAHGFYNFGDTDAVFCYNVDNVYSQENERGLKWDSIDFVWPIPKDRKPILSMKDSVHPDINDVPLEDFENIC